MSTQTNLDEQIVDTEQAQASIEQQIAETEAAIIAGDTNKTLADIEALERESRANELKVRALHARRAEQREADRLAGIAAIRKEIETSDIGSPDHFVAILRKLEEATQDLIAAAAERELRLSDWRNRLYALGAEPMRSGVLSPPPNQYGIASYGDLIRPRIRYDESDLGLIRADYYLDMVREQPDPKTRTRDLEADLRSELGEIKKPRK